VKEGKLAAEDERSLYAKMPISSPKWRMTSGKLAKAHGVMIKPVHPFLTRIGSSPRSYPKQRDKEMKKEQVWTCKAFIAIFAALSLPSRQCSYCW
jgi:hypothetical protein